ncbi:hypothetical protein D6817_05770, partial [Candidatus Pacearchaeota archaeon]
NLRNAGNYAKWFVNPDNKSLVELTRDVLLATKCFQNSDEGYNLYDVEEVHLEDGKLVVNLLYPVPCTNEMLPLKVVVEEQEVEDDTGSRKRMAFILTYTNDKGEEVTLSTWLRDNDKYAVWNARQYWQFIMDEQRLEKRLLDAAANAELKPRQVFIG